MAKINGTCKCGRSIDAKYRYCRDCYLSAVGNENRSKSELAGYSIPDYDSPRVISEGWR